MLTVIEVVCFLTHGLIWLFEFVCLPDEICQLFSRDPPRSPKHSLDREFEGRSYTHQFGMNTT